MTTPAVTTGDFPQRLIHFKAEDVIPSVLVLQLATFAMEAGGDDTVVTVPDIDVDDDAGFVPEGDEIPVADPDTSSVDIATGKVAVLGRVSREAYQTGGMSGLLSARFKRALIKNSNNALLAQPAPVAPAVVPPAGLLSQGPTAAGAIGANLDELVDAIAAIQEAWGEPTAVVANPTAWASLVKRKRATDSNESLLGAGTMDAVRGVLSVPALVTPAMPAGQFLVVDKAAVLGVWGPVTLAVSSEAFFSSDSYGIRGTFRFGARITDTERVQLLTIADAV